MLSANNTCGTPMIVASMSLSIESKSHGHQGNGVLGPTQELAIEKNGKLQHDRSTNTLALWFIKVGSSSH